MKGPGNRVAVGHLNRGRMRMGGRKSFKSTVKKKKREKEGLTLAFAEGLEKRGNNKNPDL